VAQFVVRNIENGVKARLQHRARRNGRSMEEEVRDILRAAVHEEERAPAGGLGIDFEIPELHGHRIKSPLFDK
jgi:antitoxin FitA